MDESVKAVPYFRLTSAMQDISRPLIARFAQPLQNRPNPKVFLPALPKAEATIAAIISPNSRELKDSTFIFTKSHALRKLRRKVFSVNAQYRARLVKFTFPRRTRRVWKNTSRNCCRGLF